MKPIVILGPPGAGKGTQADLIAKQYNIPHISTGDLLRAHIALDDGIGRAVKATVAKGGLVQDEVLFSMVASRLDNGCLDGYILDGFPRTVKQAEWLAEEVTPIVLHIDVSNDLIMKRLAARGRYDDGAETIKERLKEYDELTRPVISFYQNKGQLHWIDGNREMAEVFEQIQEALI